jgi:hypothetical protein
MDNLATMAIEGSAYVEEFEEYLQDEIFVDYFNIFLSLPVRITSLV